MKKYIKPVLEEIKISDFSHLMVNTNQTQWGDAKENNDFFDMDDDEGNDPWGETPDKDKYDLWKD